MIVFGSRGSDLALKQTRMVADLLQAETGEDYRIDVIETRGDRILDQPLPAIGGKGLFTAELETALREGRIDAAVHSMKDLPVEIPEGLTIGAVPVRADTADVLVYDPQWEDSSGSMLPLKPGCRVGTSSHRRRLALAAVRDDLEFADIRGNVPTRADKVRRGDYGAVVLAAAGLARLQLELDGLRRFELPPDLCAPAPAQGALAVQCREGDQRTCDLLAGLHDEDTARCVHAEREVLGRLGGGCSMPLGALVTPSGRGFRMQVMLFADPTDQPEPGPGTTLDLRGGTLQPLVDEATNALKPLMGAPLRGAVVHLLRPNGSGGELANALFVAGARVRSHALTRVVPLSAELDQSRELLQERAVAFTSARAVERFFERAGDKDLEGVRIFAGGPATAAALRTHGLPCASPTAGAGGAALAEFVIAHGAPRRGVLFPCAEDRHGDFEAGLHAAGVAVHALPLYRTEAVPGVDLQEPEGEHLVFTSPSAVRAYAAEPRSGTSLHIALGPTTRAAMADARIRCDAVAASPTAAALITTVLELRHARSS